MEMAIRKTVREVKARHQTVFLSSYIRQTIDIAAEPGEDLGRVLRRRPGDVRWAC
jgi:hypothetical protein